MENIIIRGINNHPLDGGEKILIFSKNYLNKLDNKIKMVPLIYDFSFKAVMSKNIDLFKRFLIETMQLDIKEEDNYIIFLEKELIKEHLKEHGKVIDMNIRIGKNLLIDVEINTEKYSTIKERNDLYLKKLTTLSLEVGNDYRTLKSKYIYQLNLNSHKDDKTDEKIIVEYDIRHHEITNHNSKIFVKNLAYYHHKYYNENVTSNFDEIFMAGLLSNSFTELYKIMSNILSNKQLNKFMESVINMSNDEFILHAWEKEKLDKLVQDNIRREAIEEGHAEGHAKGLAEGLAEGHAEGHAEGLAKGLAEGHAEGLEQGIEQGIEQGSQQKELDMIKSMLDNNADYEFISKVSGKSINEIKEIGESLKD